MAKISDESSALKTNIESQGNELLGRINTENDARKKESEAIKEKMKKEKQELKEYMERDSKVGRVEKNTSIAANLHISKQLLPFSHFNISIHFIKPLLSRYRRSWSWRRRHLGKKWKRKQMH